MYNVISSRANKFQLEMIAMFQRRCLRLPGLGCAAEVAVWLSPGQGPPHGRVEDVNRESIRISDCGHLTSSSLVS